MEAVASICVPLKSRWSLILRTFVSWCMWSVGVVLVQPVIVFRALFCRVCNVLRCVPERFAAQAGLAYSITERINCLYTVVVVSLLCPNVVWASDLRALSLAVHLFLMFVICCLNDSDVLYVMPRILGVCVWYWDVVYGELRYVAVFCCPACQECCCRFGWGYFESVCGEPVVKCV